MGRKSTKEDKSIYQIYREEAGLTRAQASEALTFITDSRIERIEYGALPQPEEVIEMARIYKKPELCNYYCSHECRIGQEFVPEVKVEGLPQIVLEILAALNTLNKDKGRLIEIAVDGEITEKELPDFLKIRSTLDEMSQTVEALKLWVDKTLAEDAFNDTI